MFRKGQTSRSWRAVVAAAAAYALALNLMFAGALAGRIAIDGDTGASEICLGHTGGADQQTPALPDTGKLHCVLCAASLGPSVVPTSAIVTIAFSSRPIMATESARDAYPRLAPRDPGKPPTGPPLTA
jgi:hypothetical protein